MNAPHPLRKGWCPGALEPMQTGDGLLVRLRLSGAPLDLDRAEAIADCAAQFGAGLIELSSRGNLQMRGVGEARLPALQKRLRELGLLDADAASERVRNIVASPAADVDAEAILDTGPCAAALAARLTDRAAARRLPSKFSFLIDGGGALPLGDIEADVRFEAFRDASGPRFAVALAGDDDLRALCAPVDAPEVALALASAFVEATEDDEEAPRRMRVLVASRGAAPLFRAAGLAAVSRPAMRRVVSRRALLGVHAGGGFFWVGAAAPLGRLSAEALRFLAQDARRLGAADIRVTPWRAMIVAGLGRDAADDLAAALVGRGFIVDPFDSRLAVIACAGAPACANGARAVQAEALDFAHALPPAADGIALHVSGCAKGCAHARRAPVTLVAGAAGYDLVLDGKAGDAPARKALSRREVSAILADMAERWAQ